LVVKRRFYERIHAEKIFEHNPGDHVARYVWALNYIRGKRTMDCGCGEGYGTAWLRKQGIETIGLDISREIKGKHAHLICL